MNFTGTGASGPSAQAGLTLNAVWIRNGQTLPGNGYIYVATGGVSA